MTQPFGLPPFDPSKMDPRALMELSQLIQQLPAEQLQKMQTLMHNMMAGIDVRKDMEEFEKSLPPGFREKLMSIMASQSGALFGGAPTGQGSGGPAISYPSEAISGSSTRLPEDLSSSSENMNLRDARMTVLRAIAEGQISPEEAYKLLFSIST